MQTFQLSTTLYFGADALSRLRELKPRRSLVVADPYFCENGKAQEILTLLGGEGQVFSQVQPDPSVEQVAQGVRLMEEFQPDLLLALGGGSAIDCAKGILWGSSHKARLIAIPTTSGTGSEVSSFAVLSHGGNKEPLVDGSLRPHMAILDDSLLQSLPKGLIADAGMDVAAHCLEAVASRNASAFTTALAGYAFHKCLQLLPASYAGDKSARRQIHEASAMAGIAFDNGGLGLCHGLSHALGGLFHLPHGRLNGILLPHVLRFNLPAARAAYTELARLCGLGSTGALLFALERLRKRLELPDRLSRAGLDRSQVLSRMEELCAMAAADPCCQSNPRTASTEQLAAIVRQAL